MLTFLLIYIYFALIMYLWLKFILITKLFLFLFPYFLHKDMIFFIFLKDINVTTHRQNTSLKQNIYSITCWSTNNIFQRSLKSKDLTVNWVGKSLSFYFYQKCIYSEESSPWRRSRLHLIETNSSFTIKNRLHLIETPCSF
jgi:hypothetical protein